MLRRIRLEARLTLGFALAMALLLATMATVLYVAIAAVLLDEVDTGLRERAATIQTQLPRTTALAPSTALVERQEAFAQVVRPDGTVIATGGTRNVVIGTAEARSTVRAHLTTRRLPGVADRARILVVPTSSGDGRVLVVVGASLADRSDALRMIVRFFLIAGPLALLLASAAGWLVARRALATAIANERRFLDHASHELRTPLTALKTELELAAVRPRTTTELQDAVVSAAEETDRLVCLANDLLLLSRARAGRFEITRQAVSLRALIDEAETAWLTRAAACGVTITTDAPDVTVSVDQMRMRQLLDNLLDNALQHARRSISVRAEVNDDHLRIEIADDGPGFDAHSTARAFEPFALGGLGLSIVQTIAEGHGGHALIETNGPVGGTRVTVRCATR